MNSRRTVVAEAVGTEYGARMDDAAGADNGVLVEDGVGIEGHVVADLATCLDLHTRVNGDPIADHDVVANHGTRVDIDVQAKRGRRADEGIGADSSFGCRPSRPEIGHDGRESRRARRPPESVVVPLGTRSTGARTAVAWQFFRQVSRSARSSIVM